MSVRGSEGGSGGRYRSNRFRQHKDDVGPSLYAHTVHTARPPPSPLLPLLTHNSLRHGVYATMTTTLYHIRTRALTTTTILLLLLLLSRRTAERSRTDRGQSVDQFLT